MAVNITKTSHFTAGAGNPISFSQIRDEFYGSGNNVKASDYMRRTENIDWRDDLASGSLPSPRVPDCTENESVAASGGNNWNVNSLRDTISKYVVTQTDTNQELSYSDSNTGTWNGNLDRNIVKEFIVDGTIYSDETSKGALTFSGDLKNLDINVQSTGKVYGQGGGINATGGDALYVNNTYSPAKVKVRSYGRIWSGGGGGKAGNDGNDGSSLACYNVENFTSNGGCGNVAGAWRYGANPGGQRSRCRGGGWRRGQGWNFSGAYGYHCGNYTTSYCRYHSAFNVDGGPKGTKGGGGKGRGWSNRNIAMTNAIHKGNDGNNGNTNNCSANRTSSTGNAGNAGNAGGDWGQDSAKIAGAAIRKKNTQVVYYNDNTLKGKIKNI